MTINRLGNVFTIERQASDPWTHERAYLALEWARTTENWTMECVLYGDFGRVTFVAVSSRTRVAAARRSSDPSSL